MRMRLIASVLSLALIVAPLPAVTSACCGSSTASSKASGSGGCSSGNGGSSVQPCSPYAEEKNAFGKIAVQQKGPQQPVTWGVCPVSSFGVMTVTIQIDGVNVLGPYTRDYAQHGSFSTKSNQLASGVDFYISGTRAPAGTDSEQGFYFTCTLA